MLQHLYSLDPSSPGILRLIYGLIRHDEREQYLSSLRGPELARLVDFLDEVRALLSAVHSVMRQLCRPSLPFPQQTTFPDGVCASYKSSVATA